MGLGLRAWGYGQIKSGSMLLLTVAPRP